MTDAQRDVLLSLALAGIGAFGYFYIQYGPGEALQISQDAEITFRTFPRAISILLLVLSGVYAATSIQAALRERAERAPGEAEGAEPGPPYLLLRILAVLALLVGFAQAIGLAPLYLLAAVFLFIAFVIFGQSDWLRMALVAAVGGALFHGLFVMILHLPLG